MCPWTNRYSTCGGQCKEGQARMPVLLLEVELQSKLKLSRVVSGGGPAVVTPARSPLAKRIHRVEERIGRGFVETIGLAKLAIRTNLVMAYLAKQCPRT